MKRRHFIQYALSTLALQGVPALSCAREWLPDFNAIELAKTGMTADQWQLVGLVQNHLFPSETTAPGAREVNALSYLQWVLSDPGLEADQREFFAKGVEQLQATALKSVGKPFSVLDEASRELVLRAMEQEPKGREWITELLHYLFEALLTDPVYGGNPDGIGWRWLGHQPGFRRPDAQTRYFLL